jgi:hypothetical protein
VVESRNVPNVRGIATFPTTNDRGPIGVKLNVAVPFPDCSVMEFVPEPVQDTTDPHVKEPLAVRETLKTRSPFGRMVKGSARAVVELNTKRKANGNSRTNLAIFLLLCFASRRTSKCRTAGRRCYIGIA